MNFLCKVFGHNFGDAHELADAIREAALVSYDEKDLVRMSSIECKRRNCHHGLMFPLKCTKCAKVLKAMPTPIVEYFLSRGKKKED